MTQSDRRVICEVFTLCILKPGRSVLKKTSPLRETLENRYDTVPSFFNEIKAGQLLLTGCIVINIEYQIDRLF